MLGKQIRYVLKRGIPYVVILGSDEQAAGQLMVKNLACNEQKRVAREWAAGLIRAWQ